MAAALDPSTDIVVIGAGAMGAGIAQVAAAAGHRTKVFDANAGVADAAIARIAGTLEKLAAKGKITAEAASATAKRLQPMQALQDCAGAALVVEAIVENLDVKRKVFAELEGIAGPQCILATNTSSISITAIGAALERPERLVGMHFFNPAPLMELVEIVSGLATDRAVAETIYATAAAWGKVPVYARSTPGFIVNRVARPFYAEGLRLLNEQAASPSTIDAVMRECGGFRMGPFELMDLIGHDVNYTVTRSVFDAYYGDPRFTPSLIQKELVDAGFLGRKSGRGFYAYDGDSKPPPPVTEAVAEPPHRVTLGRSSPLTDALAQRLPGKAEIDRSESEDGCRIGDALLCVTDGRSATQRARDIERVDVVLIDLALDYAKATRVALARADPCSENSYRSAVGALQVAGFAVSPIKDVPGMAVMRTVAMLANEAADAVDQGVCSAADADMAMTKGVNYPRGPLAWADRIGVAAVQQVLDHMARYYGEVRYRTSPLIRRRVASGTNMR